MAISGQCGQPPAKNLPWLEMVEIPPMQMMILGGLWHWVYYITHHYTLNKWVELIFAGSVWPTAMWNRKEFPPSSGSAVRKLAIMIWEIHGNSIDERDNTRFRTMLLERDWAWSTLKSVDPFILESVEVEVDKPSHLQSFISCAAAFEVLCPRIFDGKTPLFPYLSHWNYIVVNSPSFGQSHVRRRGMSPEEY